MSTVKKTKENPDSYSPAEKPKFIDAIGKLAVEKQYQMYKNMPYRIDILELPQTLKIAGIARKHDWTFKNIEEFHQNYTTQMKQREFPYVEIALTSNLRDAHTFEYIFGCVVDSVDDIPEGLVCFDTGLNKFMEMTFRADNAQKLVESEHHGLSLAFDYLGRHLIPENKDIIVDIDKHFQFKKVYNGKACSMSVLEVYKCDIQIEPEMSLYIPLKN